MANSSQDYSGSSADEANSCVVENFMWDEWTRPSTVADEVSTATFLPDLITSSTSSTGLSFHQTDMLSSWMSTFHPLALHSSLTTTELDPHPELFMHEAGLPTALEAHPQATSQPTLQTYFGEEALPLPPSGMLSGPKTTHTSRYLQALGPLSPSSPLAIHNGVLNPLGDPWDGGSVSSASVPSWAESFSPQSTTHSRIYIPDQQTASAIDHVEDGSDCTRVASRPRHTDIFIGPNGTIEATPGGWTPHFYDGTSQTTTTTSVMKPMKMMATLREAGESSTSRALPSAHAVNISQNQTKLATFVADYNKRDVDQSLWLGKHRLQLAVDDDSNRGSLQLKRSKLSVARGAGSALQWGEADQGLPGEILRTYNCPSGSLASQAMDIIAIGPALNTNGKPRARRGSATDPQSVYARQRRERINDRLKKLQQLVPNGAKVDIVTMLDEAYDYVKFLQYQLSLLHSDELWVLANPYNYNGMDISNLASEQTQELESSAT